MFIWHGYMANNFNKSIYYNYDVRITTKEKEKKWTGHKCFYDI